MSTNNCYKTNKIFEYQCLMHADLVIISKMAPNIIAQFTLSIDKRIIYIQRCDYLEDTKYRFFNKRYKSRCTYGFSGIYSDN